jgi:hypothetical protein
MREERVRGEATKTKTEPDYHHFSRLLKGLDPRGLDPL